MTPSLLVVGRLEFSRPPPRGFADPAFPGCIDGDSAATGPWRERSIPPCNAFLLQRNPADQHGNALPPLGQSAFCLTLVFPTPLTPLECRGGFVFGASIEPLSQCWSTTGTHQKKRLTTCTKNVFTSVEGVRVTLVQHQVARQRGSDAQHSAFLLAADLTTAKWALAV